MKIIQTNSHRIHPAMYNEIGYLMNPEEQVSIVTDGSSNSMMERTTQFVYVFLFVLAVALFSVSTAHAEPNSLLEKDNENAPEIRVMAAISKFTGTKQVALAFTVPTSNWLYSNRTEIAVGSIGNSDDTTAFLSVGPLWRWGLLTPDTFFELGFSPTVLADTQFGPKNIGGHLHFSSSVSIGHKLGKHKRSNIALRVQHISNGGLNSTNPGLDSVGLSFSYFL